MPELVAISQRQETEGYANSDKKCRQVVPVVQRQGERAQSGGEHTEYEAATEPNASFPFVRRSSPNVGLFQMTPNLYWGDSCYPSPDE